MAKFYFRGQAGNGAYVGGIERGWSPDDETTKIGTRKPLPGSPGPSKVLTFFWNLVPFLWFLVWDRYRQVP